MSRMEPLRCSQQVLTEIKSDDSMSITNFNRPHNLELEIPWMNGETENKNCGDAVESPGTGSKSSSEEQLQKPKTLINPSLVLNTDWATKDCGGVATETIKDKSTPLIPEAEFIIKQRELEDRNEQGIPIANKKTKVEIRNEEVFNSSYPGNIELTSKLDQQLMAANVPEGDSQSDRYSEMQWEEVETGKFSNVSTTCLYPTMRLKKLTDLRW